MNRILQSYLSDFTSTWELTGGDPDNFEVFSNYIVLTKYSADRFNPVSFTTQEGECGIDGAAILLADSLIASPEEAKQRFEAKRRDVPVQYVFTQAKTGEDYSRKSILNFGDAVRDLLSSQQIPQDSWLQDIAGIHDVVIDNAGKISGGLPNLSMYYIADGKWSARQNDAVLNATITNIKSHIGDLSLFDKISFEIIDFDKTRSLWMATKNPVESTFTVSEWLSIPSIEGVKQAYLAVVSAPEFVNKVLTGTDGRIRHSIFEQNVRHFLGNNDVNSKISSTLLDEKKRGRFCILNNGITLVAPHLQAIGNKQITIKDFQIVNGCQTSHVLYNHRDELDESVTVAIKAIQVEDRDIVDAVVEATNSQSKIPQTQLYATKDQVREIQEYFDARRESTAEALYFERRTRECAGHGLYATRIFDIHLLGKSFAAMFLDQPHLASAYAGQLFDELGDEIFDDTQAPIAYYTAAMAHYRLFLLFNSGDLVDRSYSPCKWHIMMMMRYKLGGVSNIDWSNQKASTSTCERILRGIDSTRAAAQVVNELIELLPPAAEATRKAVRKQGFTADTREAVVEHVQHS